MRGKQGKKTLQSSFPLRTPVPFTAKEEGRGEKSKDILFQDTIKEIHFFVKVSDRVFRSTNPHILSFPLVDALLSGRKTNHRKGLYWPAPPRLISKERHIKRCAPPPIPPPHPMSAPSRGPRLETASFGPDPPLSLLETEANRAFPRSRFLFSFFSFFVRHPNYALPHRGEEKSFPPPPLFLYSSLHWSLAPCGVRFSRSLATGGSPPPAAPPPSSSSWLLLFKYLPPDTPTQFARSTLLQGKSERAKSRGNMRNYHQQMEMCIMTLVAIQAFPYPPSLGLLK